MSDYKQVGSRTLAQINEANRRTHDRAPDRLADSATERDLEDNEPRVVTGVKGMNSSSFSKRFPNAAAMERWMESEEAGNYTIQYVKKA